uniref:Uncharacterized protein n=1 Tax=Chromera velia CCMP2878 TaxID=1169474 RepID=A0A0G4HJU4_9ALVE|eukprot:Cvel_28284.t1-p1 / transcript=Cvel_28284.t1 / gene=Cvel_28284 / organism=Chromera_velia_CCMP2878 / gene_product=hypothetical protein / transcript_product=hypothetical protein / location=Cvel_scaffold3667:6956-11337(+) / protein_length=411 / sequence_SO=supercontig / SO=protein_coding / is_pseudo=false
MDQEEPWEVISRGPADTPSAYADYLGKITSFLGSRCPEHDHLIALSKISSHFHVKSSKCIQRMTVRNSLRLSSVYQPFLQTGVHRQLVENITKFIPELGGIWLGHWADARLLNRGAMLRESVDEGGVSILEVSVEVLVLRPEKNDVLVCEVTNVSSDGITATAFGIFPVFVPLALVHPAWIPTHKGDLLWSGKGPKMSTNSPVKIQFVRSKVKYYANNFVFEGSLADEKKTGVLKSHTTSKLLPLPSGPPEFTRQNPPPDLQRNALASQGKGGALALKTLQLRTVKPSAGLLKPQPDAAATGQAAGASSSVSAQATGGAASGEKKEGKRAVKLEEGSQTEKRDGGEKTEKGKRKESVSELPSAKRVKQEEGEDQGQSCPASQSKNVGETEEEKEKNVKKKKEKKKKDREVS